MPFITVGNGVTFYYTDSGAPTSTRLESRLYKTIFFLHGHTFHSGIFQRLANVAGSKGLRIICLNRREYPGTTPYTDNERRVISKGSFKEREKLLQEQGTLIALAVDRLIQQLALPGRVALSGWSLGSALLLAVYCSINRLSKDVRQRLKRSVGTFVLLDPASYPLGFPIPSGADGYCPLFDDKLPPKDVVPAFQNWVSSYYQHGDLSSRDIAQLQTSLPLSSLLSCMYSDAPQRRPTTQTMTPAELESVGSFTADLNCETMIVEDDFVPILGAQSDTLLFDGDVREAWGDPGVWCLYGDASVWTCIYGSWCLEERMRTMKKRRGQGANEVFFKCLSGANHFMMWDYPERTLDLLRDVCACNQGEKFEDLEF